VLAQPRIRRGAESLAELAQTIANTPAVFARHGVFIAREVFDRA
jgi:hypothetical protein